jgi:hypothetical protein
MFCDKYRRMRLRAQVEVTQVIRIRRLKTPLLDGVIETHALEVKSLSVTVNRKQHSICVIEKRKCFLRRGKKRWVGVPCSGIWKRPSSSARKFPADCPDLTISALQQLPEREGGADGVEPDRE